MGDVTRGGTGGGVGAGVGGSLDVVVTDGPVP